MTFSIDWKRAIRIEHPTKPAVMMDVYNERDKFLNELDKKAPYCTCCQNRTEPIIAYGGEVLAYVCYPCQIGTANHPYSVPK